MLEPIKTGINLILPRAKAIMKDMVISSAKHEFTGICFLLLLSVIIVGLVVSAYVAVLLCTVEVTVVFIVRHKMKRADQGESI